MASTQSDSTLIRQDKIRYKMKIDMISKCPCVHTDLLHNNVACVLTQSKHQDDYLTNT